MTTDKQLSDIAQKSIIQRSTLKDALSGEGPGTLRYALRSSAEMPGADASLSAVKEKPKPERTSPKSGEIFTLKPTVYGVGIDLKELARRFRAWRGRRRSSAS
jgi:hypothetical protein